LKAKRLALPLVLIMVLSTLGIAYAAWTDYVDIEVEANMGSLTLAFDTFEPPYCRELHWRPEYGESLKDGEYLGKDVATCSVWVDDRVVDVHTGKDGYKTLNIDIFNAYPCLYVFTTFRLHNIGTIPLNIYEYVFSGGKYNSAGDLVHVLFFERTGAETYELYEDRNDNGVLDDGDVAVIWASIPFLTQYPQIEPCEHYKTEIDFHFLQESQQCHNYRIVVRVHAIQWNKLYEVIEAPLVTD